MHPEFARRIAGQHQAALRRQAQLHRLARRYRLARPQRRVGGSGGLAWLAGARLTLAKLVAGRARPGDGRSWPAPPAVFLAGPEAFGFRSFLTPAEARQLLAAWAGLLSRYAGRLGDPASRPAGAVPFEVIVLGRQAPELAAADGPPLPGLAR